MFNVVAHLHNVKVTCINLRMDLLQDAETWDDGAVHRENLCCRKDGDGLEDGGEDDMTVGHNDQLGRRPV